MALDGAGQATPTGWKLVDDIRATVQELEPNTRAEGVLYTEGLDQVEELTWGTLRIATRQKPLEEPVTAENTRTME